MNNVVELNGISKRYGATQALADASVDIRSGEVHGILGRNGAGKSTLVSALAGLMTPDSGTIHVDGGLVWSGAGGGDKTLFNRIAMVHQTPALVDSLSVAENLHLEPHAIAGRGGYVSWRRLNGHAAELLRQWHLDLDPQQPVGTLGPAQRHLLAIARAMARDARVVILDEPTAALPATEIDRLFDNLTRLKEQGTSFAYISHHLEEITRICDRVTVLRDGRVIATRDKSELSVPDLVQLVAGQTLAQRARRPAIGGGNSTPVLELNQVVAGPRGLPVDLTIQPGEILAMTGLLGSGAEELSDIIAGAAPNLGGTVHLNGRRLQIGNRTRSVVDGVGYIPADRHAYGYVSEMSVRENVSLSSLHLISNRWGVLSPTAERKMAADAITGLAIKTDGQEQLVGSLSGGNQQKAVLARAMATQPGLLVAVHPTRGVDVGAKVAIYNLLQTFAGTDKAVLLVTDELEEIDAVANRVVVMRRGAVVGEYTDWSHQQLLLAMEGATAHV